MTQLYRIIHLSDLLAKALSPALPPISHLRKRLITY